MRSQNACGKERDGLSWPISSDSCTDRVLGRKLGVRGRIMRSECSNGGTELSFAANLQCLEIAKLSTVAIASDSSEDDHSYLVEQHLCCSLWPTATTLVLGAADVFPGDKSLLNGS